MFKRSLLSIILLTIALLHALAECPGKVTSLHFRMIQQSLVVVPVMINHSGPYDMMVDTGAQVTAIDPALATELNLSSTATAGVTGAETFERDALLRIELIQAGSQEVQGALAVVENLRQLQAADRNIRGILGSSFLGNFDLFLDYERGVLCLDGEERLQPKMKGEHIALINSAESDGSHPSNGRFVIAMKLSGGKSRDLHMILDSGSNAALVFDRAAISADFLSANAVLKRTSANGVEQRFAVLTTPDIQIGKHLFRRIQFVTPMDRAKETRKLQEDGLLPTVLFRSIYLNHKHAYAVIEPWY